MIRASLLSRYSGGAFGWGFRRAFTLIEMLTTVAALVIVLGVMISLARDVRTRSADLLTRRILVELDRLVDQYRAGSLGALPQSARSAYPAAPRLLTEQDLPEKALRERADANIKEIVRTLKQRFDLDTELRELSIANYNEVEVLDAWGSPIVYMPAEHPRIGMAVGNRSFFFSAGPDRQYLTRQDNLYSYEAGAK